MYGDTDSLSFEDWDRVIGINLTASWLVSKEALPHLRKTQGSIIHTASVQGFASQPLVVAYTASKGGVVALTKAMAIDHAPSGIRVNCVCPGSVRTPMLRQGAELFSPEDPEGAMNEWGRKHPLGRLLEPEDVAPTYVFLASHLARAITGVALPVDGGLIARLAV